MTTFTHDFRKKVDLNLNKWTFYAWLSDWKMRTFMCDFLKIVYLKNEKCVHLRMVFWKRAPQPEKCGPLLVIFWKYGPLPEKCWPLRMIFWENNWPRPVNVDLLRMIFWNMLTLTWKCGSLCLIFSTKVDLNLENVDFYASFYEESGPLP